MQICIAISLLLDGSTSDGKAKISNVLIDIKNWSQYLIYFRQDNYVNLLLQN